MNKIFKDYVVSSDLGDYEKLTHINNPESFSDDKSVEVFKYVGDAGEKAYCGTYHEACRTSGKRRVNVKTYVKFYRPKYSGKYHYSTSVHIEVRGEKKVWRWWKSYHTALSFERSNFTVEHYPWIYIVHTGNTYIATTTETNWHYNGSGRAIRKYKNFGRGTTTVLPSNLSKFRQVEVYATSTGIGNRFAHIYCN